MTQLIVVSSIGLIVPILVILLFFRNKLYHLLSTFGIGFLLVVLATAALFSFQNVWLAFLLVAVGVIFMTTKFLSLVGTIILAFGGYKFLDFYTRLNELEVNPPKITDLGALSDEAGNLLHHPLMVSTNEILGLGVQLLFGCLVFIIFLHKKNRSILLQYEEYLSLYNSPNRKSGMLGEET